MDRVDKAINYFLKGFNCAQAVVMAVQDLLGVDLEILKDASSAFGGGFARLRGNCGTVSAIGFAVGFLAEKTGDIEKDKARVYADTRMLADKFKEKFNTLNCAELLKGVKNIDYTPVPSKRNEEYYKTRPCLIFVTEAVRLIEEYAESAHKSILSE